MRSGKPESFLYHEWKESAAKRGHDFLLSEEQFSVLTSRPCFYCHCLPSRQCRTADAVYDYNGIDRFDNKLGYTLANSVPCCAVCNMMKGRLSAERFIRQAFAIIVAMNDRGAQPPRKQLAKTSVCESCRIIIPFYRRFCTACWKDTTI